MKIILAGSGGCMRELIWQIQEQNKEKKRWEISGYVDPVVPENGHYIQVGEEKIAYLGDDDYVLKQTNIVNVVITVGSPLLRKRLSEKYKKNPSIQFPNLVLGNTNICKDVQMGVGCIISMDSRISTNVVLGDFVFLNTGSKICHDSRLGDYVTLSPDVTLAGAVCVGSGSNLGLGTKVRQEITIGKNVISGMGSVIVKDIESNCTVVGVPAIKIGGTR